MRLLSFLSDFLFPQKYRLPKSLPQASPAENAQALFDYGDKRVKELVWEIKYKGNKELAEKIGIMLYDTIVAEAEENNIFEKFGEVIIMPIPISDRRRLDRGWNQAELLTKAIKRMDTANRFKHLAGQLRKMKHTESQTSTATRKERLTNIQNSMKVANPQSVRGACVALIDDVTTTGATFKEGVRALREAGAKKIMCFAIAH